MCIAECAQVHLKLKLFLRPVNHGEHIDLPIR